MAAFIKQENQRVLWNTIQKMDLFHRVLKESQKPLWFKEIIGSFYEKYRDQRLSRLDLENLNRQVVEYMVSSLKRMALDATQRGPSGLAPVRAAPTPKHVSFQEEVGIRSSGSLIDMRPEYSSNLEKKNIQSQQYVSEFSTRQQEYEQMLKRDTPPDVNFKEELSDDVIKNMDELLEQQRRLRELDLQEIAPPPLVASPPQKRIQPTTNRYSPRRKLVIEEELDAPPLMEIPVLELQNTSSESTSQMGKNIAETLEELKQDILDIKQILAGFVHPGSKTESTIVDEENLEDKTTK